MFHKRGWAIANDLSPSHVLDLLFHGEVVVKVSDMGSKGPGFDPWVMPKSECMIPLLINVLCYIMCFIVVLVCTIVYSKK